MSTSAAGTVTTHDAVQSTMKNRDSLQTSSTAKAAPHRLIDLSRWPFVAVWLGVFLFHGLNLAFLVIMTALNWYLAAPAIYGNLTMLHQTPHAMVRVGVTFLLLAQVHVVALLRMLYVSIAQRRLSFQKHSGLYFTSKTKFKWVNAMLQRWHTVFGEQGFLGPRGAWFDGFMHVRDAVGIAMQSYQAYQLSESVSRVWINQFCIAAIALNCLSTPLIQAVFETRPRMGRILGLILDTSIDFCCSIIIPISILYPYSEAYDASIQGFSPDLIYDDTWFINGMIESQQILVTSPLDFITTIVPLLSMASCASDLKQLVRR